MQERVSPGLLELYYLLGIDPPVITPDVNQVRIFFDQRMSDQQIMDFFIEGKIPELITTDTS